MQHKPQISTPTIFFPGTHCDERIWIPVWDKLELHQRSYVPLQWADSLDHMMALSKDRIAAFGEKVNLVGFSMGGYIASLVAIENPEKINSLTLLGYNPKGLSNHESAARQTVIESLERHKPKSFSKNKLKVRMSKYLTKQELENEFLLGILGDMESDLGPSVLKSHLKSTTPRKDLFHLLADCAFPIHLLVGQHDQVAPVSEILNLSKLILQGSYTVIEDTAHMIPISNPARIAEILGSKLD